MELWTEYEGITIDDAFPLNKLLQSQGRSAFYSTVIGNGEPRLIRLIACHFDEEEILARWRGVQALGHPNFIKLERHGQLVLDEVTVIYAVLERVDVSLAEVVKARRLTVSETAQLAVSLASAVDTLHVHGFVHEHLTAEHVFAVGDVVKLRSDCIRETPEGEKGVEAKRRDAYDLAAMILEALTQGRTAESAIRAGALPKPFDQIVLNGLNGAWGIAEMIAALQSQAPPPRVPAAAAAPPTPASAAPAPASPLRGTARSMGGPAAAPAAAAPTPAVRRPGSEHGDRSAMRPPLRIEQVLRDARFKAKWIVAAACVLLMVAWGAWHFMRSGPVDQASSAQAGGASNATSAPAAKDHPSTPAKVATLASNMIPATARNSSAAAGRVNWRVVAYTFNHQDQAQQRAASVAQKHPELRPEVFAPKRRAPYLVTIGGVMSKDAAFALAREARNAGLPRDTYAQNYSGN